MESLSTEATALTTQPLEELVFVESGTHNLKEINPIVSVRGKL